MVGPHLDQAQRVTRLIEIEIELSGLGLAGNLEVHVGEPAQANGGLVHKAAGLAKVAVLCKLAHLGQLDGVDGGTLPQRLHGAAVRGLDRSRAGKTAAGGNGADRGEIKARRRAPGLGQLERHAADQRGSGLALVLAYGQVAQVDLYQRKVGVDYAHHVGAVGNGHAVHGDIERAGNNVAPSWSVWLPEISERPGAWTAKTFALDETSPNVFSNSSRAAARAAWLLVAGMDYPLFKKLLSTRSVSIAARLLVKGCLRNAGGTGDI